MNRTTSKYIACLFSLCLIVVLAACKFKPSDKAVISIPASDSVAFKSVKDMQADLIVLWKVIKEVHPGFGIYASPDSLLRKYEEVASSIRKPLSEDDFKNEMYQFVSLLGCGHTQIRQSAGYIPDTSKKYISVPFDVLVKGQRAYMTHVYDDKFKTGDEIISMNDIAASVIIQKGTTSYSGDGYVKSFKELYLSEYAGFIDAFNHYNCHPPLKVVIRSKDGEIKTIIVHEYTPLPIERPEPPDSYAKYMKVDSAEGSALYFDKKKNTAALVVNQLVYDDTVYYAKYFGVIANKGIKNLILDMRHNGGGDLRIAINLMSYLMNEDFGIIKDLWTRITDPSANQFIAEFDDGLTENFKSICIPTGNAGGLQHWNASAAFGHVFYPIHPAKTSRFNGKLIVLIDGATFSSAALFVAALKAQRKNVVFVGRETAGAEEGCNGFAMQKLTLPATKIVVEFPLIHVVSMAKQTGRGRGLMPDHFVTYTPFDIVQGNDPDLTKAEILIR